MGKAEIWLIRTYWDFEFPRPFLPNFEFVGGLHCQPAKPLPKVSQLHSAIGWFVTKTVSLPDNHAGYVLRKLILTEDALVLLGSKELFSTCPYLSELRAGL